MKPRVKEITRQWAEKSVGVRKRRHLAGRYPVIEK